jgi:hypothetical protein
MQELHCNLWTVGEFESYIMASRKTNPEISHGLSYSLIKKHFEVAFSEWLFNHEALLFAV